MARNLARCGVYISGNLYDITVYMSMNLKTPIGRASVAVTVVAMLGGCAARPSGELASSGRDMRAIEAVGPNNETFRITARDTGELCVVSATNGIGAGSSRKGSVVSGSAAYSHVPAWLGKAVLRNSGEVRELARENCRKREPRLGNIWKIVKDAYANEGSQNGFDSAVHDVTIGVAVVTGIAVVDAIILGAVAK